jgi:hypothetical protein
MRTLRIILSGMLVLGLGIFVSPASAETTPTLTKNGITLSFPRPVYEIASSTSVSVNYTNNSGFELYALGYEVTDRFGSVIVFDSPQAYKVANGTSGTIVRTWYAYEFVKAVAPLTVTMIAKYGYNSGKSDEFVSAPFEFVPRVAVLPTPAPTVTVTAKPLPAPTVTVTATPAPTTAVGAVTAWAEMETLKARVAMAQNDLRALQAKLKKICAVKPKPKGC